jgi:hypothetical protein
MLSSLPSTATITHLKFPDIVDSSFAGECSTPCLCVCVCMTWEGLFDLSEGDLFSGTPIDTRALRVPCPYATCGREVITVFLNLFNNVFKILYIYIYISIKKKRFYELYF